MFFNKSLDKVKAVCINLKTRKDKKRFMKVQAKRKDLKIEFYTTTLHENPKKGCLLSHLSVIRKAQDDKVKQLLVLEDDAKFTINPRILKDPPKDWDILYLGGTVHRIVHRNNKSWPRVHCWTTHAYILNMENKGLLDDIMKAENYKEEIDRYYLLNIHPKYNVYMCDPMVAIQKEGYSDIEGTNVNYDFMQTTISGLSIPEYEEKDGNYILKLPHIDDKDLPTVSIITPTYNRRELFSLANRNFEEFNYPKDKIEWVIIDDSKEEDTIDDLVLHDKRIQLLQLRDPNSKEITKMTIAQKRNIGVSKAKGEIIIHMDDDDYYPPESILARVKVLVKYKESGIRCVGCTQIGTYDIMNNRSSMSSDGPISFSEATMAYYRDFWLEQPFRNDQLRAEHKGFMENRLNKCMDIPYAFVIIALTHHSNYTSFRTINSNTLKFRESNKDANYYDIWDEETRFFFDDLKKYLQSKIKLN
jgi:hypothetical protein